MSTIQIYDTTLRDGSQAEELNIVAKDKVLIARALDQIGIHYIEGGWPGANPTDDAFFQSMAPLTLTHSRLVAFGSTHHPTKTAETDKNLKALINSQTQVATIFGKCWDMQAQVALGISLERNIEIIAASIAFLKQHFAEVFFDAEHLFDGFKANPEFSLACLDAALQSGADCLIACDTNGGSLPNEVAEITSILRQKFPNATLGIHAHNDAELAVACTLAAVEQGATHVQGTINGYGERCGNANLCSIIPNLEFKKGLKTIGAKNIEGLTDLSRYVAEIANLRPFLRQPFVGGSAFAHKGGIHVSAVMKNPQTYEHIDPSLVGNTQRVLLSDQAGKANILFKAQQLGYTLEKDDPRLTQFLQSIKTREEHGFEYSVAEASFELMLHEVLGFPCKYFTFKNFFVADSKRQQDHEPITEATVLMEVDGNEEHTAASGNGPVNALDLALRKALERFYPRIANVRLKDFKVRVVAGAVRDANSTASFVRVLIESSDGKHAWNTIGVSHNIIEAAWQALVDCYRYKLLLDEKHK